MKTEHDAQSSRRYKENWDEAVRMLNKAEAAAEYWRLIAERPTLTAYISSMEADELRTGRAVRCLLTAKPKHNAKELVTLRTET